MERIKKNLLKKLQTSRRSAGESGSLRKIAIVGNPNVGKSVIFNSFTGSYTVVSNYPGTTVEVSRGKAKIGEETFEIVDTPGMYSLLPITEEERVARDILMNEKPCAVLNVLDAKNLERMLGFTLQLIEAELPLILVLNMMDEAEKRGKITDCEELERELRIPVVPVVATTLKGMDILKGRIE
ncbi:MAG TPA: FeoB small GTPase domain-containing protein, partial [Candidatus Omnitrophota bacterium]|nr:FeoB small GTPase domain-containing protein [Candidatus Omnitrophota bacterium]